LKSSTLTKLIILVLMILISVFCYIYYHSVVVLHPNTQNVLLGTPHFRVLGNIYGPDLKPLSRPLAVAVSDNSIYIADSGNSRVVQYSDKGKFVRSFGDTGNSNSKMLFPTDLAVSPNKGIYVADRMSGRVMVYNRAGDIEKTFPAGTDRLKLNGFSPLSLAIDKENNVFVFDAHHQRLVLFDENGKLLKVFTGTEAKAELSFVNGIAISEQAEKIYISNSNKNKIMELNKNGVYLRDLPGLSHTSNSFLPRGIALDNTSGQLLITASFQHKILFYDLKTNEVVNTIGIVTDEDQAFKYPNDIAINEDKRRVYVTDTGHNRIVVLEYVYK